MQKSLYELKDEEDERRRQSDFIYHCFTSKDTTELNKAIRNIRDLTLAEFPQGSKLMREMFERVINSDCRSAKHATLLFGLYLTPQYVSKIVGGAEVDPSVFKEYMEELTNLCHNHLNGEANFDSLQAFVEQARTTYEIL
jgi:hypothetical protein